MFPTSSHIKMGLVLSVTQLSPVNAGAQQVPSSAERFCETQLSVIDGTDRAIDSLHPKYFVEIAEVSSRGTRRLIHTSIPSLTGPSRMVCQRVNSPVDVDSKLVLRVNQTFLQKSHFDGKFAVTARVEGTSGSRAVEVPGYSVIGKTNESAPVSVADVSGLAAAMREVRRENDIIKQGLIAARTLSTKEKSNLSSRMGADARLVERLDTTLRVDSAIVRERVAAALRSRRAADSAGTSGADSSAQRIAVLLEQAQRAAAVRADSLQRAAERFASIRWSSMSERFESFSRKPRPCSESVAMQHRRSSCSWTKVMWRSYAHTRASRADFRS